MCSVVAIIVDVWVICCRRKQRCLH